MIDFLQIFRAPSSLPYPIPQCHSYLCSRTPAAAPGCPHLQWFIRFYPSTFLPSPHSIIQAPITNWHFQGTSQPPPVTNCDLTSPFSLPNLFQSSVADHQLCPPISAWLHLQRITFLFNIPFINLSLYPSPQLQQAFSGNSKTTLSREAGGQLYPRSHGL